jgi:ABC-type dipeptide/oligopeptide/nickel transport system permease component
MLAYLLQRVIATIPVLLGVSLLTFSMLHLVPGDPVALVMSTEDAWSKADVERVRDEFGLNDPLYVQYGRYVLHAVRGDFGISIRSRREVSSLILQVLPYTLELALCSMLVAMVVGVPLGVIAAVRHNTWIDTLAAVLSLGAVSMPSFWLALLLIFLFSVTLNLLPATGQGSFAALILPVVALGLREAAETSRLTRSGMLEVLRHDYITTARAKGLAEVLVLQRHALRNALIPVITMLGLQFGRLLAGTVVIETVFARQGIGRLAVEAIQGKDFPTVQGVILFMAVAYVLVNLLVDLSYAWVDPRIRFGST